MFYYMTKKIAPRGPMPPTRVGDPTRAAYVELICDLLKSGMALKPACRTLPNGPTAMTFIEWIREDAELGSLYARAREIGYQLLADDLLSVADELPSLTEHGSVDSGSVAHQRLRVDTRKWMLCKMLPKIYGDKLTQEVVGKDGGAIQVAAVDLRGLNDNDLAAMEALLTKAAAAQVTV